MPTHEHHPAGWCVEIWEAGWPIGQWVPQAGSHRHSAKACRDYAESTLRGWNPDLWRVARSKPHET